MTLLVLSLVALAIFGTGFALGYYCGHQDGYDDGWRARSYTADPCRPSLRLFNFTHPTFDDSGWSDVKQVDRG